MTGNYSMLTATANVEVVLAQHGATRRGIILCGATKHSWAQKRYFVISYHYIVTRY
jgi:hypothetical protein